LLQAEGHKLWVYGPIVVVATIHDATTTLWADVKAILGTDLF
jgi:hypothetical protein